MNVIEHISQLRFAEHWVEKLNVKNASLILDDNSITSRSIDMDYEVLKITPSDISEKEYCGLLKLSVGVIIKVKGQKKTFKADMQIVGVFFAPKEMGEEKFRDMLSINGTSVLYSIVRGLLISVSSQCLISGMVRIPLINVRSFCDAKIQAQERTKTESKT